MKEALRIIETVRKQNRKFLLEHEAKRLCELFNIPVAKSVLVKTIEEAVKVADEIGYPVVLKIVSPDIVHKSDIGGVKLNIKDPEGVKENFLEIMENVKKRKPKARIEGFLVQEMVPQGTEVIVGAIKDPFFGHAVMFGLGGIFVEVLRDVSFRIVPITRDDAYQMIRETKAYPILEGYRTGGPRDVEAVVEILFNVSRMLEKIKAIKELDLNPIMVYEKGKGAKVVDARIFLE